MTKLQSIEKEASGLPEEDRAALAAMLLGSLSNPSYDVDDEEVARRVEEIESGLEPGISHADLSKALGRTPSG